MFLTLDVFKLFFNENYSKYIKIILKFFLMISDHSCMFVEQCDNLDKFIEREGVGAGVMV